MPENAIIFVTKTFIEKKLNCSFSIKHINIEQEIVNQIIWASKDNVIKKLGHLPGQNQKLPRKQKIEPIYYKTTKMTFQSIIF